MIYNQLVRYVFAHHTFSRCRKFLQHFHSDKLTEDGIKAADIAFVVTYCSAFKHSQNDRYLAHPKEVSSVALKGMPTELRNIHDFIIERRDAVVAHSDLTYMDVKGKVILNGGGYTLQISNADMVLAKYGYEDISNLLEYVSVKLMNKYRDLMKSLPDGEYLLKN
ncbi:hypothetical protein DZA37_00160 [Kangiella sp. HD9-110m-PIT-SAG06]|nr:hypothetical protein DZA37_00160 [Kangiella sp. HD9-110m-PIT-SAG06]